MKCFNKSSEKVAQKRFCKAPQHLDHFSQESHCHSWVSHKSWSRNPRNPLRSAKIYRKIRADTNNSLWASSTGIRLSHQMLWNAFFATPSFEIKMTQLYSEYTSYLCHVLYVLTYGIAIVHRLLAPMLHFYPFLLYSARLLAILNSSAIAQTFRIAMFFECLASNEPLPSWQRSAQNWNEILNHPPTTSENSTRSENAAGLIQKHLEPPPALPTSGGAAAGNASSTNLKGSQIQLRSWQLD